MKRCTSIFILRWSRLRGNKKYETTHQDDAVWGPYLKKQIEVRLHVLKEMQPLIKKRQAGERLSDEEQVWLESVGKEIWEKLLK